MHFRRLSFVAGLLLLSVAGSQEPAPKLSEEARKDLHAMQGTWKLESVNSSKKGANPPKNRTLFIGGELFLVREGGKVLQIGTIRLVTNKNPRRIDVTVRKGLHEDNTMLGIYKIKDGSLELCIDPEGEGRPDSFATKADTSRYHAIYKQDKVPGEEINICGRFTSNSFDPEGKKKSLSAIIEKRGDSYLVRWTVPDGLAYIGTGIRTGNTLSVAYANRGSLGLSVYKIEKGPKLIGTFAEVGGPGFLAREELIPDTSDSFEARLER